MGNIIAHHSCTFPHTSKIMKTVTQYKYRGCLPSAKMSSLYSLTFWQLKRIEETKPAVSRSIRDDSNMKKVGEKWRQFFKRLSFLFRSLWSEPRRTEKSASCIGFHWLSNSYIFQQVITSISQLKIYLFSENRYTNTMSILFCHTCVPSFRSFSDGSVDKNQYSSTMLQIGDKFYRIRKIDENLRVNIEHFFKLYIL